MGRTSAGIVLEDGSFDGLIFDCDGTLVDTAPAHYGALQTALATQARSMEAPWYFARVGLTPKALLDEYEATFGALAVSHAELLAGYKVAYQAALATLKEVALVANLARAWKGRVPMAVASNGERENVSASLRSVGLLELFDTVVAAEDVARGKPEPDVFLEAARRLGVRPERCVVLEDSDEGLAGARAAGMRAIDIRESWTPEWKKKK